MNDLIFKLADNKFLRKQLKITSATSKAYKEMQDAEYVLRFYTLNEYWKQFPGNMTQAMDEFMKTHQHPRDVKLKQYQKLFEDSIKLCHQIWGDYAFMRPEGHSYRNQVLQGVYDVQMVAIASFSGSQQVLISQNMQKIKAAFIREYNSDKNFQTSIRQFTSNSDRVKYRIEKMIFLISKAIL